MPRRRRSRLLLRAALIAASALLPMSAAAQIPTLADSVAIERLRPFIAAHPALAARRAELAAAEARVRVAGAAPAATLDAEIEEVPDAIDITRAGSIRLGLSRDLLPRGERRSRRALARTEIERTRLELELSERALVATVDRHLTRAASALGIAHRLAAEDSLLDAAEVALRARFATGDARYIDVLRMRSERLRAQSDRAGAVSEARISRRALLALLSGADTDSPAAALVDSLLQARSVVATLALPPLPSVEILLELAGELRLAAADVARAEAARALVRASLRPAIAVGVGVQRFETGADDYALGATLGASVSLPFTARRAHTASRLAADQEILAAKARLRAAELAARSEIASALDRYDAAREQLALYDVALLRTAREEREGALAAYRAGDLSLLELLDFERALARVEVDRLRNRMTAADALADLVAGVAGIDLSHNKSASERTGSDR